MYFYFGPMMDIDGNRLLLCSSDAARDLSVPGIDHS